MKIQLCENQGIKNLKEKLHRAIELRFDNYADSLKKALVKCEEIEEKIKLAAGDKRWKIAYDYQNRLDKIYAPFQTYEGVLVKDTKDPLRVYDAIIKIEQKMVDHINIRSFYHIDRYEGQLTGYKEQLKLLEPNYGKNFTANDLGEDNNDNLRDNYGYIVFARNFLQDNLNAGFLNQIFSNFFPMAIVHNDSGYDTIKMYGFSPHFKKIGDGEAVPQYELILTVTNGKAIFNKILEV